MSSVSFPNTDEMLESNMGLVYRCAKRYKRYIDNFEFDDVMQVGRIALWEAILRFNSELGLQFSTYAYHYIHGKIRHYFRNKYAKKNRCVLIDVETDIYQLNYDLLFIPHDFFYSYYADIEEIVEVRETLAVIDNLPIRQSIIIKKTLMGYTQKEIAVSQGISQATVSRDKACAVDVLKQIAEYDTTAQH